MEKYHLNTELPEVNLLLLLLLLIIEVIQFCEVSGLGRLKEDIFYELFNEKIDNPTFICTDGNNVYSNYSELLNIPHYIKPSNYNDILNKNNYYNTNNEEERELILLNLYNNNMIDYLDNMGKLTYLEFKNIKNRNN